MNIILAFVIFFYSLFLTKANNKDEFEILNLGSNDLEDGIEQRIIGGSPAKPGQFPWQVAIRVINDMSKKKRFCGGSLIGPEWVLTTAHCLQRAKVMTMYFGGTTIYRLEDGRETAITKKTFITHPTYNVALIRLNCIMEYTPRIQPIALAREDQHIGPGVTGTISGWGRTTDGRTGLSKTLNYVNLTTITNRKCAKVYRKGAVIPSTLCTVGNPLHNTCYGDGGGALVIYEQGVATQIAVNCFVSKRGCSLGKPSGYVRVSSIRQWIKQQTGI